MSSCPYEARGENCQCPGEQNGHLHPTALLAERKPPSELRVIESGPFKGRTYIKTPTGWQRVYRQPAAAAGTSMLEERFNG